MYRLLIGVGVLFLLVNTGMVFHTSLSYFSPDFEHGFLKGREAYFYGIYQWGLYAHILSTPWVLIFGLVQFFPQMRNRFRALHRIIGHLYTLLILFFAAPGGLIMGCYAFGGKWARGSFILLGLLWWISTAKAWLAAREKQMLAHQRWMFRSYNYSLSAITLRLFSFIFVLLGLEGVEVYIWIAWLSWLPQSLLGEIWLRKD